jgi:hypothetical protein
LIVDIPALNVRLVAARPTGPVPEQMIAEAFSFIVLAFVVVVEAKLFNVIANPPVSNVPARMLGEPPPVIVKLLPRVQYPLTPLNFTVSPSNVTLLVVNVLPEDVARKFKIEPAALLKATPVAAFSQLPCTLRTEGVAKYVTVTVPVAGPEMLISRQVEAVPIVTI